MRDHYIAPEVPLNCHTSWDSALICLLWGFVKAGDTVTEKMATPLNTPLKVLRSHGSLWVTYLQKRDIRRAEQASHVLETLYLHLFINSVGKERSHSSTSNFSVEVSKHFCWVLQVFLTILKKKKTMGTPRQVYCPKSFILLISAPFQTFKRNTENNG